MAAILKKVPPCNVPLPPFKPPCTGYHEKGLQDTEATFKFKKQGFVDMLEDHRKISNQICLENRGHARKIRDNAKFTTKLRMAEDRINLDAKRDKLKLLLDDEDEMYQREIVANFENRQANKLDEMRKRVAELKSQREARDKAFVNQKMDEMFQRACEPMRAALEKRLAKEIAADWNEQLAQKRRLECEADEEERMWAYVWQKDADEKWRREEAIKCLRCTADKRAVEDMDKQVEYKERRKVNEDKIKQREGAMLAQDVAQLLAMRQKLEYDKKARYVVARKHQDDMLATRNYYRDRRLKREEIVALEFLKRAVRELHVEEADRSLAKRELMRAISVYREYLKKRDCLENSKEEALQHIIDGVIEAQHEQVMASRKREQEQRRQLYEAVMAGRALQVEDLKKKREMEAIEEKKLAEDVKKDWAIYLAEVEADRQEHERIQRQYRCDLDCQVTYNEKLQCRLELEKKREDELCAIEERLFNHRVRKTLQEAVLAKSNPYRQPLVGKIVDQRLCPPFSENYCKN